MSNIGLTNLTISALIDLHSILRDLGLLKRHRELQKRYDEWVVGIVQKYGSVGEHMHDRCNIWRIENYCIIVS